MNQIDDVCKDIEKTINLTVQNTLNTLERDCEQIADLIDKKLAIDRFAVCISIMLCSLSVIFRHTRYQNFFREVDKAIL